VKHCAILLIVVLLAGCGGTPRQPAATPQLHSAGPTAAAGQPATPEIPPVDLGHRPPNTPMTSANMPFFDTVAYCEVTTRKIDSMPKGPAYENCAGNQAHYRSIIGAAIDAKQFKESKVEQCARASRSAYEGMWYCMNDQPFS
jgi:hypothetical protein